MLEASVVAVLPALEVTSPVRAGIWDAATEPLRSVNAGCTKAGAAVEPVLFPKN